MVVTSRRTRRGFIAALVASLCFTLLAPPAPAVAIDDSSKAQIRNRLERKINAARDRHGLRKLRTNDKLQRNAQDHAEWMANHPLIPLLKMHDPLSELWDEAPNTAIWVSENIGRTTRANAARALHRQFMNSPLHRANILQKGANRVGVGVAKSGGYVWVVERFATVK